MALPLFSPQRRRGQALYYSIDNRLRALACTCMPVPRKAVLALVSPHPHHVHVVAFSDRVMAARCSSVDHETIANKPHQPRTFSFPKREFGVTTVARRSFQPSWFDKWPWLHYCEDSDSVFCFTCMKACSENKLHSSLNAESAFISAGFTNWKKASERFNNHEASKCHKEAV